MFPYSKGTTLSISRFELLDTHFLKLHQYSLIITAVKRPLKSYLKTDQRPYDEHLNTLALSAYIHLAYVLKPPPFLHELWPNPKQKTASLSRSPA